MAFEKETGEMAKGKRHAAAFSAKVALETWRGKQTVGEPAARFEAHPTLIHQLSEPGAPFHYHVLQPFRNVTRCAKQECHQERRR